MSDLASTMRILRPAPGVFGFYDGRIPGRRAFSDLPNWLDDGAFTLGIASWAIVDGDEALVYDTHMSLAHARRIRETVAAAGVRRITVVLSHWHEDHVAGNAVFADCEIIAHAQTLAILAARKDAIETGFPPIAPLVLPTATFEERMTMTVGRRAVELRHFDVHSIDATLLWAPDEGLLFAGDALEDPVTYVDEVGRLKEHLKGLDALNRLPVQRILPNHGVEQILASGGYGPELIRATRTYIQRLLACRTDNFLAGLALSAFAADLFENGWINGFEAYDEVHRRNVQAVRALQV